MMYARCPKCFRTELSTWSEQYYNASAVVLLKLRLGATPYRCEYCRLPERWLSTPFQIDHIIARQHGGETNLDNLALR